MADCYTDLLSQNTLGVAVLLDSSTELLHQLLEAELIDRSIRSIRYQINAARFPIHHDLQGSISANPK